MSAETPLQVALPAEPQKKVHPLAWIPTLYVAESIPYAGVLLVSVLMYRSLRADGFPQLTDGRIAFYTAWLALPWSLKPFWSPLLELYKTKKHIVLITQIISGALFGLMALSVPAPFAVQASLAIFFILAFNSATHDIAADGVYLDTLPASEQSLYVGIQSASWTIGQVFAQGGLVWIAGRLEQSWGIRPAWSAVMGCLSVIMILIAGYHTKMLPRGKPAAASAKTAGEVLGQFKHIVQAFFLKENLAWMLAFVLLYRVSEAQVTKIAPLFLRADRVDGGLGLSTQNVGLIYGTVATIAFVLGSIAGGLFAKWRGLKKALPWLCVILNVPNVLFTVLAFTTPTNLWVIATFATIEKFALGFGMVALMLYMMQQLAPGKFKMAHYGFATALMNIGVMVPGMVSGTISDMIGYKWFFVYVVIAAIPSFLVAFLVPFREIREDDPEEDPARTTRKPSKMVPALFAVVILGLVGFSTYVQAKEAGDSETLAKALDAQVAKIAGGKAVTSVTGKLAGQKPLKSDEVTLEAGKCYSVVATGLEGVEGMAIELGSSLKAEGKGHELVLGDGAGCFKPAQPTKAVVLLRGTSGGGLAGATLVAK